MRLQQDAAIFYFYWAYSLILMVANGTRPFNQEENHDVIAVLEEALALLKDEIDPKGVYFYIALTRLTAGETLEKSAGIFEEQQEQKWREKYGK